MIILTLQLIITSCTVDGNLNKACFDKVMECKDENYSTTLRPIKPRSLAYCISQGLTE